MVSSNRVWGSVVAPGLQTAHCGSLQGMFKQQWIFEESPLRQHPCEGTHSADLCDSLHPARLAAVVGG